jgi:ABC-type phosphate transport system ATPase subunit
MIIAHISGPSGSGKTYLDKWRKKITFNDPHYRELGYEFLSPKKIYKTVSKIIKLL